MRQEKHNKTTNVQSVITKDDICARFGISRRYALILYRRGTIVGKPRMLRRLPGKSEMRACDFFVTRSEYRRLEREGLVPPPESEVGA